MDGTPTSWDSTSSAERSIPEVISAALWQVPVAQDGTKIVLRMDARSGVQSPDPPDEQPWTPTLAKIPVVRAAASKTPTTEPRPCFVELISYPSPEFQRTRTDPCWP
jgi:hypothetical protein